MRNIFNTRGIGLVEVMVAASILGGLSLVVMQLTETGQKSVSRVEKGIETSDFDAEINALLSDTDSCKYTLRGIGLANVGFNQITGNARYPAEPIGGAYTSIYRHDSTQAPPGDVLEQYRAGPNEGTSRNNVRLVDFYFTGWITVPGSDGQPANSARIIKIYEYRISSNRTVKKSKVTFVSMNPRQAPDEAFIEDCILVASKSDSVWNINPYGIHYAGGVVSVGKTGSTSVPLVMDIAGPVNIGPRWGSSNPNVMSGTLSNNKNNHIFGGRENSLQGDLADHAVMLGGKTNSIRSAAPYAVILGGGDHIINAVGNYVAVIGGHENTISGVENAVIAGYKSEVSGNQAIIIGGHQNYSSGDAAAIVAGARNEASNTRSGTFVGHHNTASGINSAIVGGHGNVSTAESSTVIGAKNSDATNSYAAVVGGDDNVASGARSVIIGGRDNVTTAEYTAVAGGRYNEATAEKSGILGGRKNIASGIRSAIIGGNENEANWTDSAIVGGIWNNAVNNDRVVVVGGQYNEASGLDSVVIGGETNTASGQLSGVFEGKGNSATNLKTIVLGGEGNVASAEGAVNIGGHNQNNSGDRGVMIGSYDSKIENGGNESVVIGGARQFVSAWYGAILGGADNYIKDGTGSAILGGSGNYVWSGDNNAILSGRSNWVSQSSTRSVIVGGDGNRIEGGVNNVVLGGYNNYASFFSDSNVVMGANNSVTFPNTMYNLIGGQNNTVWGGAHHNLIYGNGWKLHSGTRGSVMLKDEDTSLGSTAAWNEFWAIFAGGLWLCPGTCSNGRYMINDGNGWTAFSDRNMKKNFRNVNLEDIVKRIDLLPITTWQYKDRPDSGTRSIGPMAQDFTRLLAGPYKLNKNDKTIHDMDISGVTLAGLKGLIKRTNVLRRENEALKEQIELLRKSEQTHKAELEELRQLIYQLKPQVSGT